MPQQQEGPVARVPGPWGGGAWLPPTQQTLSTVQAGACRVRQSRGDSEAKGSWGRGDSMRPIQGGAAATPPWRLFHHRVWFPSSYSACAISVRSMRNPGGGGAGRGRPRAQQGITLGSGNSIPRAGTQEGGSSVAWLWAEQAPRLGAVLGRLLPWPFPQMAK